MTADHSPWDVFLDWYRSLPSELQDHMAFLFGGFAPSDALADSSSLDPLSAEAFCERVAGLATTPWRGVGVALMLRAFTDFSFKGRATSEDWSLARKRHDEITALAKHRGHEGLAGKLEESAERWALRSRQWIREAERWSELRQGMLSDESVDEWLRRVMAKGPPGH